jgi:hypothetical protein
MHLLWCSCLTGGTSTAGLLSSNSRAHAICGGGPNSSAWRPRRKPMVASLITCQHLIAHSRPVTARVGRVGDPPYLNFSTNDEHGDMSYKATIHRQIGMGLFTLAALGALLFLILPHPSEAHRVQVVAGAALVAVLPLFGAIASTVTARYADEDLILGWEANKPSGVKQAILQNTLEQTVISEVTLLCLGLLAPPAYMQLCMVQALCFLVGRLIFSVSYQRDPMKRFAGFVIGQYAALASLLASAIFIVIRW